jgi:WD40 repeat protein
VLSVAWSPDGAKLATAGNDGTVRLWDVAARRQIGEPLFGHNFAVSSVAFNPGGDVLASAGYDRTVRLWDVSSHQPIGAPFTGHTDSVYAVAFSPDGRTLASASHDGTVRLWDNVRDVAAACALAAPYVTRAQVQGAMPPHAELTCPYTS